MNKKSAPMSVIATEIKLVDYLVAAARIQPFADVTNVHMPHQVNLELGDYISDVFKNYIRGTNQNLNNSLSKKCYINVGNLEFRTVADDILAYL